MWKRLIVIWAALKGDLKLLWHALRHPQAPAWLKLGTAGLVLYLFMPVDFIPDFIPLLGVMDDVAVLAFGLKWLLKKLPAQVRVDAERRMRGETIDHATVTS
jgi:uncharacterized membrane protein YkvA (DUF1232 family)